MTAQVDDVVVFRGHMYALIGVNGRGLFEPGEHGLQVHMMTNACRRGYVCEYAVKDDQLTLIALRLGMAEPPTQLFGADLRFIGSAATYSPIRVPLLFTGGLLLGARFIRDPYAQMGRHPAWKYAEVLELSFSDGRLGEVADHSELTAERRAAPRDLDIWIETAYHRSHPPMV
jgi:hypothetical protein